MYSVFLVIFMLFSCQAFDQITHVHTFRTSSQSPEHLSNSNSTAQGEPQEVNLFVNPQLQVHTIINAIQELALDISYTQWERSNFANFIQSPVSISALLSLLLLGSRGDSHIELKRALRYPNNIPDAIIHESFQKVLGSIFQDNEGVFVTMASRLFLQKGTIILGRYTQIAQTLYNSQVRSLDFKRDAIGAQNAINEWIDNATNGQIKELITHPFPPTTEFVAVNAIYFNGAWEFPFSPHFTFPGTFNTGTKNISIPMMTQIVSVPYIKGDFIGFDMILLPYKGSKYGMIIMTPHGEPGIKSLRAVENALDADVINALMQKLILTKVSINIPKMKLSHKVYLKNDLEILGVSKIFDRTKADFGRITSKPGVFIDNIVHEAIVEINEEGTRASAATGATANKIGVMNYFRLNRPSIVMIRDLVNGLTLFYSRVFEPDPLS